MTWETRWFIWLFMSVGFIWAEVMTVWAWEAHKRITELEKKKETPDES